MAETLRGGEGRLVILDIRDVVRGGPEPTIPEWLSACHEIGTDANIIRGEANYLPASHPLGRKTRLIDDTPGERVFHVIQPTPKGPLVSHVQEIPGQKPTRTKMFIESEEDYALVIALLQSLRECGNEITAHLAAMRRQIGEDGFLTVFIPQPLEMFYLILQEAMVYHFLDWPETHGRAMAEVEQTDHLIIDCAAAAGADMIMLGGAGTEIFAPEMIRNHIIQPSIGFVRHAHEAGLFTLMHCCGRTKVLLDHGWFHDLRPTIFESFTHAPLGDIEDVAAAAHALPDEVFFKGGLSLDRLRRGDAVEAAAMTRRAIEQFGDRRYIVAGTCEILTATPRENLLAVTSTAAEFE